ncbi:dicarboxylate/amino acid:cation symporter [Thermohalobacter berrensis]|uniref:dicarboxylate/amino acid:cation symporter n=1 Tax=Thermohalobacter berrensis TaxID=99594 RepID=UPI000E71EF48|nr:dicarboxylate/amino acid:cation symporter [Thermohalobacter berrensis]
MNISILVGLLLLGILYLIQRQKVSFGIRVLTAMGLGIAFGTIFKQDAQSMVPIGYGFVKLIKMLVMPLVVAAIISSITSLDNPTQLRKIGFKTIGWFLFTAAIASLIGIVVANVLDLGAGMNFAQDTSYKAREIPKLSSVFLDLVPSNPIAEMANGKILPVIIFSVLIGIALTIENTRKPEVIKPVKEFIEGFTQLMFRVTKMVLKLTPYGVFGLMANVASKYGISTLLPLGKVVIAVYLAAILQIGLTYGSLLTFVAKVNPIRFFKKVYPAQVVAFTTRSSYGTLPVTLRTLKERVKISEKIATFVAPLGATINMDGCGGLYPAIVAVFVAKVFNIDLTLTHYIMLITTATLASIGTAGVPGTASIMTTVVLTSLGLPLEGIAMVLGIDAVLDMARTCVNVTGDTVVSLLVANSEKQFDREGFNRDTKESLELNP